MKLNDFFNKAISVAIENDPRGKDFVIEELNNRKKDYEKLSEKEKLYFDETSLNNPYSDSRIIYGEGNEEINNILVGIDIETGEVVLAELLRQKGIAIDLILAHHPSGRALANLYTVIGMQADILSIFGVPINVAESLLEARAKEVERKILPANLTQTADSARLLKIPLMCLHTAGDNMVATYLQNIFDTKKPNTLDDIIDLLLEIDEYKEAQRMNNGPKIMIGNKKRKSGKVFVDMTGGTSGSKDIYENLKSSGINTIVGMHINEDHRKEAEKHHINVVIAGHIASDNLGLNLLLDRIIENAPISVMECSGFRRFKRE
ncbi:MAG TPA: NGG1p interacting factor NIF3 [Nitrospirae bacterium]|nr:NGG1p interacting factor NIF3 [Nitrospirota bacterium]